MLKCKPLIIYFISLLTFANNATEPPQYPNWTRIGLAKLSVLWFDIYQAELSSETGVFEPDRSFKLTLTYLRNFTAETLIDETFAQFSTSITKQQALSWRQSLKQIWPDVTASDQISFIRTNEGDSQFFFNKHYLGTVKDKAFGKHFADIWLAKDSAYPKLAAKLKGEAQ